MNANNIKTVKKPFFLFVLLGSLSSCTTYYVPITQNVPLFEEKNQGTVTAGLEAGQYSSGLDLQGAYSITDHLAVTTSLYFGSVAASYSYSHSDGTTDYYESDSRPYNYGELGVGYYTKLGSSRGIFEVYGGFGHGGVKWNDQELNKLYSYNQFFVQPQIGGHLGIVDIAFSSRINYLDFGNFQESFLEPGLTFRIGGDKIKFYMQMVTPILLNSNGYSPQNNTSSNLVGNIFNTSLYETFHMSMGIHVPIGFSSRR